MIFIKLTLWAIMAIILVDFVRRFGLVWFLPAIILYGIGIEVLDVL